MESKIKEICDKLKNQTIEPAKIEAKQIVENAKIEKEAALNLGILENLGYRPNVPVNLYVFSRKKVDINLFSNIVNGIVLEGFLEAKP